MSSFRLASEAPFPYSFPGRVCYFLVSKESGVSAITSRDELRTAVEMAHLIDGTRLFAAWPGEYRTDLFLIDDLYALAAEVGLVLS